MMKFLTGLGLACALASSASAATIISAASVTASSERSNVPVGNIINQSGLSANYVSGVTDFDTYIGSDPTHTTIAVGNEWFSDFGNLTAQLDFDLGAVFNIDRIALWVEEATGFGEALLSASTDGINYTTLSTINPFDNPRDVDYSAEVFGFATTSLRYFRMNLSSCPQPDSNPTNECALGEIAFSAVDAMAPVPVPAGGILMVTMLGAFGGIAARRRKAKSA